MGKKVEFNEVTKEAFKNKAFVRKLLSLETGEEVRKALKEKGIVLTPKELDKFAEVLVFVLERGPEMTDSELEKVVGGVKVKMELDTDPMILGLKDAICGCGTNVCNCVKKYKDEVDWNALSPNSFFAKFKQN